MNYDNENNNTRFAPEHPAAWTFGFVNGAATASHHATPPAGDLIHITDTEDGQQTVNARELHRFLESKQEFANWIKNRIEHYKFVEDRDFTRFLINLSKTSGGRPATEYLLTVDMAMALSMVENNAKGEQARAYFIDCKKRLDTARIIYEEAKAAPPRNLKPAYTAVQKAYLEILTEQIRMGVKPDTAAKASLRLALQNTARLPKSPAANGKPKNFTEEELRDLHDRLEIGATYRVADIAQLLPPDHRLLERPSPKARDSDIGTAMKLLIGIGAAKKLRGRHASYHILTFACAEPT